MDYDDYRVEGDWSSAGIAVTDHGYQIEYLSRVTGQKTGLVILVPFSDEWPKGLDLEADYNDWTENGRALIDLGRGFPGAKTIKRGFVVR